MHNVEDAGPTLHLPVGLWVTPKAKALKGAIAGSPVAPVDWAGLLADASREFPVPAGVVLRIADEGVDQGVLVRRGRPQPDAPFIFTDYAAVLVGAASAGDAPTVLAVSDLLRPLHGRSGAPVAPPSGLLLVASGPRDAVLSWFAGALRVLRVAGSAVVSKPGYKPASEGAAGRLARGTMSRELVAAVSARCGAPYEPAAVMIPLHLVAPLDERVPRAA